LRQAQRLPLKPIKHSSKKRFSRLEFPSCFTIYQGSQSKCNTLFYQSFIRTIQ